MTEMGVVVGEMTEMGEVLNIATRSRDADDEFLLGYSTAPVTGTSSGKPRIRPSSAASSPTAAAASTSTLRDPDAAEWPCYPIPSATKPSLLPSDHATRRRRRADLFRREHSVSRQEAAAATSLPHLGRSGAALPIRYDIAAPLALQAHLLHHPSFLPHADLCARLLMLCVLFRRRSGVLLGAVGGVAAILGAAQGL